MNSLCRALIRCSKRTRPSSAIHYSTKKSQAVSTSSPTFPSLAPAALKEVVAEDSSGRPRPSEIPFQPKVANLVNLIGAVQSPVKFLASHDGKYWAGTIISQESSSGLPLSIPVLFEGDLAHTAACHLKENDDIYIAGHLSADKMPLTLTSDQDLQVVAHSLNFVRGSSHVKRQFTSHKQEMKPNKSAAAKKALDSSSWSDLFNNPAEWKDYRNAKLNQVVKPKHPDFKHKQDGRSLWLSSAPSWIVKELEGFEINGQADMPKRSPINKEDSLVSEVESWKDLIENPGKWWDNRLSKATSRHPDFRHKDSGEGLWLNKAPDWALQKLPPQEPA